MQAAGSSSPQPSASDWALLGVGLVFAAIALFMLGARRDGGVVLLAFAIVVCGVATATLLRKYRYRRLLPLRASIAGGVVIRPERWRAVVAAITMLGLGIVIVLFGYDVGRFFQVIGVLLALGGAVLVVLVAVGRLPPGYIRLDPPGLTIGRRGFELLVPWDRITAIASTELHDNPFILLTLDDPTSVAVSPPSARERAIAFLLRNYAWVGAHVALSPASFGMDQPLMFEALKRVISEPSARQELRGARHRLEG